MVLKSQQIFTLTKKKTPKIGSHYFCLPEVVLDSGYI